MPDPFPEEAASYRYMNQIYAELGERVARKPGMVRVEQLGRTPGGRPLWAFHVTDPQVPARRDVLVMGGIHALEWIGVEVAVDLLEELLEVPPRGVRVTVIPILNPDGRARVEVDLVKGVDAYRRGNRAGVDLNRNFDVHRKATSWWRKVLPDYHRAGGPRGLSEPETAALDRLLARVRYDRACSLHAFGGYLFFPWSGRWEHTEDHARFVELGREMEAAMGAGAYRPMQLARWGFFFRAQGTEIDHLYGRYGTLAYLMEVTRSGVRAWPPLSGLGVYFRRYNPTDSRPHRARAVAALRVLTRAEDDAP